MLELFISGSSESPSVKVQGGGSVLSMEGRSTSPTAVTETFRQITLWIDEFIEMKTKHSLKFEFKLEYYSTLTSRLLLDLFLKFEKIKENGHDIQIDWYYDVFDNDLKEAGEAYATMVHVPFVFVPQV